MSDRPTMPIGQRAENQEVPSTPPTPIDIERAGGLALPQSVEVDLGSPLDEPPQGGQGTSPEESIEETSDVFEGLARSQRESTLTHREQQVIALAAKGIGNIKAGAILNIAASTIKSHYARIGDKLKIGDRTAQISHLYEIGGKVPESLRDHFELTERMVDIIELVAQGHSNALIGEKLFISEDTVKAHISRALRNTGAKNRTHLVTIVYGLVEKAEDDSPGGQESADETNEQE